MSESDIALLIPKINDGSITSLADIAMLTYPAFLRRTESSLSLTECHHLYQQAIYSHKKTVFRAPQMSNQSLCPAGGNSENTSSEMLSTASLLTSPPTENDDE